MEKGYLYVLISIFLIALSPVAISYILDYNNVETASVVWSFFALTTAFLWVIFTKQTREVKKVLREHWRLLGLIGFFTGFGVLGWFYSIQLIGAEITSFMGRTGTLVLVLLSVIFLKERFNLLEMIGGALTLIGVLLITFSPVDYLGAKVLFIVIGSSLYSVSQLLSKKHIHKISPIALTVASSIAVFIMVLTYALILGRLETPHISTIVVASVVAFLSETLAVYLIFASYKDIGVGKSQLVRSAFPFIVIIYTFLLYRRLPLPHQVFGGLLIVGGVMLLLAARKPARFKYKY
jgi:drug/metabolite transporter (DMT)-like permease